MVTVAIVWEKLSQPQFYDGCSWFKFNNLRQTLGMAMKSYPNVAKELKLVKVNMVKRVKTKYFGS